MWCCLPQLALAAAQLYKTAKVFGTSQNHTCNIVLFPIRNRQKQIKCFTEQGFSYVTYNFIRKGKGFH